MENILISVPFNNWRDDMDKIPNQNPARPNLYVDKIHIQSVDWFGKRIGFIKFQVTFLNWNDKQQKITSHPRIVFMRGGAVGILCILKVFDEGGKEYALVTIQPRIPAGIVDFCEIPAGMLDEEKGKFAGKAAEEMKEETGLEIQSKDLIDLTNFAYGTTVRGIYPSAGACDEFIRLFLYRQYVSSRVRDALIHSLWGEHEGEIITVDIIPLEELWSRAPDAKALSALYLYERYLQTHPNAEPLPVNEEMESKLLAQLSEQNNKAMY